MADDVPVPVLTKIPQNNSASTNTDLPMYDNAGNFVQIS